FYDRSQEIRKLVLGVTELTKTQPGKILLLRGVNTDMFWSAVYDRPFRLFGVDEVYLVPEDEGIIANDPQLGDPKAFYASVSLARNALAQNNAVVLDVAGGKKTQF